MAKPYRVTAGERARLKRLPRLPQPPDVAINLADLPEASDAQLARMGRPRLGRAPRKAIALRIDGDVLAKLRRKADRQGIGYQTLINDLLATAVRS